MLASNLRSISERVPALDGLRAIAVLLVLAFHLTPDHDSNRGLASLYFKVADIGWIGVDLFFVLSGYLITSILVRERMSARRLLSFWARRLRRLVPVYLIALLIVFFVVPLLLGTYTVPTLGVQLPYWLYYSNYVPTAYGDLGGRVGMGHFWSLAVEMQFYLVWPVVILFFPQHMRLKATVALLLVAPCFRWVAIVNEAPWHVTFGFLPSRLDGLAAGSLVALASVRIASFKRVHATEYAIAVAGGSTLAFVAWYGLAGAVFQSQGRIVEHILRITLPTIGALTFGALLVIALRPNIVSAILSWRGFSPLARCSYAAYVSHYLFLPELLRQMPPSVLQGRFGLGQNSSSFVFFLVATSLAFFIASLSWIFVEKKLLRPRE